MTFFPLYQAAFVMPVRPVRVMRKVRFNLDAAGGAVPYSWQKLPKRNRPNFFEEALFMDDQSGKQQNSTVCVDIPKALYDRVEAFCKNKSIAPNEFILDAVSEKLTSVHKERRKKQRL